MSLKPLDQLPEQPLNIERALLSVSDKSGIVTLAQALAEKNVEIISTGGTAETIRKAGITVRDVSEITGFPECLDGRVKTLHPHIHGGVLARTSHEPDLEELKKHGIQPIELVVVNLYPFSEAVSSPDVTPSVATEHIDIGGPTLIRASAKNFAHVCVLTDPDQYHRFLDEFQLEGQISFETRRMLALEAFRKTAFYDAKISHYFSGLVEEEVPEQLHLALEKSSSLRYGENPHQPAAIYGEPEKFINCFHGKQLSYNNYLDMDAALGLMSDFRDDLPTVAIFKHTVPCGAATADTLADAYSKAFSTDPVSPFGGIVIVNRPLDLETASRIDDIFTEIIIAPDFEPEAKELLVRKKNRRLVEIVNYPGHSGDKQIRTLFGGALLQLPDREPDLADTFRTVTKREPTAREKSDLLFAWRLVRHVKSNGIVFAGNGQTLGIGTGQTSRVDSSEIAIRKAEREGLSLGDSVIASDAFFPFADGVEAAAEAGATAVIQPGGSVRDDEVIEAADRHNLAMIFTGKRHFRH
ncbi:MAG: bifunctional phosphoribosylaminoimidazolecarboxamide formyltransferase/IMP cyclohydrolase [Balneolaceae bacterium]